MFKTTGVPILGMIQNMNTFYCPHCHESTDIFRNNQGIKRACENSNIELLGEIPLHANICDDADRGKPTVIAEPDSVRAKIFVNIAEKIATLVGLSKS